MHLSPLSVLEAGAALDLLTLGQSAGPFQLPQPVFWPRLWQEMVGETKLCVNPCTAAGVHESLGSPGQKLPLSSLTDSLHPQCDGAKENPLK